MRLHEIFNKRLKDQRGRRVYFSVVSFIVRERDDLGEAEYKHLVEHASVVLQSRSGKRTKNITILPPKAQFLYEDLL